MNRRRSRAMGLLALVFAMRVTGMMLGEDEKTMCVVCVIDPLRSFDYRLSMYRPGLPLFIPSPSVIAFEQWNASNSSLATSSPPG